jgi:hypothetical protein
MRILLVAALIAVAAPATAAPIDNDEQFRIDVRAFCTTTGRTLAAWGTLHLDGTVKTYRFATLDLGVDASGNRVPGSHDAAYVIQQAPGKYWLITHWWNAAAFHAGDGPPDGEPAWLVLDDTWIQHDQMHNHGKAKVSFALRGGELVVLADDDYNSRLEPDSIEHVHATKGVCTKRCPRFATHELRGLELPVSGPAKTMAALEEPPTLF